MKRIPANLPRIHPARVVRPSRFGLVLATLLGAVLAAGCASFESRWKRAVTAPPAAIRTSPRGVTDPLGAWSGTWQSRGTGHTGALRCLVERPAPPGPDGQWSFTYHATWSVFRGTFPTRQTAERRPDGSMRSTGSWTLPKLLGGRYDYDITIQGDHFAGAWRGGGDSGSFEMRRAPAGNR